jgi:hypothetical protein
MRRVIVESPFGKTPAGATAEAAELERNVIYARRCMADSLRRGEAPFLSHLLYPQVLNDKDPEQRIQGIKAGFTWGLAADMVAVYSDYLMTPGMEKGISRATLAGQPIEYRRIGRNPYTIPATLGRGPL